MRSMARRAVLLCCLVAIGCAGARTVEDKPAIEDAPPPAIESVPPARVEPAPVPEPEPTLDAFEGVASWYGAELNGQETASGEVYDQSALTAAHREWPFGTMVRVTNLDNGHEVTVRINDRGPQVPGREIDLSREAARGLAINGEGTARVRLEVLEWGRE